MSSPDVIVVGAGLAGLSSAALLAAEGASVVLVEESMDVGGRMASLELEGFQVDAGLHCFHYAGHGPLGELDRVLGLGLEYLECTSTSYLLKGRARQPIPPGAVTDSHQVPGFSLEETERINRWFNLLMEADPAAWAKKSVADLLIEGGFGEDELVRAYAGALGLTLMGAKPEMVSASLMIAHGRSVGHPGFHVSSLAGGPGRLVKALAAMLGEKGARVALGSKVHEIEVRDKKVVKVSTSSEECTPGAVIYAGTVRALPALISGDSAASLTRKSKRLVGVSGIALEFGLASAVSDIQGVLIDPEEAVIGRFPTNLDPSLAPEGAQISSWMVLVPDEDLDNVKLTRTHIRRLKKIVSGQFPEMADLVKWERLRTLPTVCEAAPLPAMTGDRKFKPVFKGVDNMFLAGDGVASPGVLSGVAVSSALDAAARVKKHLAQAAKDAESPPEAPAEDDGPEEAADA